MMLPSHWPVQHFLTPLFIHTFLPLTLMIILLAMPFLHPWLCLVNLLFYLQDFIPGPPSLERFYCLCQEQNAILSFFCLPYNTYHISPPQFEDKKCILFSCVDPAQRMVLAQSKCSLNICLTNRQMVGWKALLYLDGAKTALQSHSAGINIASLQVNGLCKLDIKFPVLWMRYLGLLC